jgi:hypothetical protein
MLTGGLWLASPEFPPDSVEAGPRFEISLDPVPGDHLLRFAVIGDHGLAGPGLERVAAMIEEWVPDFIITLGDNNYPDGAASTIDANIGQYFQQYIANYRGAYGPGSEWNRFFPTLGNHDLDTRLGQPYFDYFTLPGNERYYSVDWFPVELFALNSDSREPDGVAATSRQAAWLQQQALASTACWRLAYFHHAPYTSGLRGPVTWMRWPFAEWGIAAVLTGHDHFYERIERDGITYFVNGLGGSARYDYHIFPTAGSQTRFNRNHGAMLVTATTTHLRIEFLSVDGRYADRVDWEGGCGDRRSP